MRTTSTHDHNRQAANDNRVKHILCVCCFCLFTYLSSNNRYALVHRNLYTVLPILWHEARYAVYILPCHKRITLIGFFFLSFCCRRCTWTLNMEKLTWTQQPRQIGRYTYISVPAFLLVCMAIHTFMFYSIFFIKSMSTSIIVQW